MNKTAIEAKEKMNICHSVMQMAHISYEQWVNLLFDMGCLFAEEHAPAGWPECLLQNKALGFWDWFIMYYVDDDKTLQYIGGINSHNIYIREKRAILYRKEILEDFKHLISRINEKL